MERSKIMMKRSKICGAVPVQRWGVFLVLMVLGIGWITGGFSQTDWYVDIAAGGGNTGADWPNAFNQLHDAFDACNSTDIIHVAQGVYKPTSDNARDSSFTVKSWMKILGGYPTTGGARNPKQFPTVLSGDIGSIGDSSDNSFHVVKFYNVERAIMDGFIIEGGFANGGSNFDYGGGVYMGSLFKGDTLTNCIIRKNYSKKRGGGIFCKNMKATIRNCRIYGNVSDSMGGGILFENDSSMLINSIVVGNKAKEGGGTYVMRMSAASNHIYNCTFVGNEAMLGGALFNQNTTAGFPDIRNTILWSNRAIVSNPEIRNEGSSNPSIQYSDIEGCGSSASWVGGNAFGINNGNNLDTFPLFFDADGFDNMLGTPDDSLKLQSGSPCYGMGMSGGLIPTVDIEGIGRSASPSLGAYENTVMYPAGKTWENSFGDNLWYRDVNWYPDGIPDDMDTVIFDGVVSNASCTLTINTAISSIYFVNTPGLFCFANRTLTIYDSADFSGAVELITNDGTILFNSPTKNVFIPKTGELFPTLFQIGTGQTFIKDQAFRAEELRVGSGTLFLGNYGAKDTVEQIWLSGGTLNFGNTHLYVTDTADFKAIGTMSRESGALTFAGTGTQPFKPCSFHFPDVTVNTGATVLALDSATLMMKSLTIQTGATFTAPTNNIMFIKGSFNNSGTFNHNNGKVEFDTSTGYHTITSGGSAFHKVTFGGSGSTAYFTLADDFMADTLIVEYDTLDFGNSVHAVDELYYGMMSNFDFNACSLRISGCADFTDVDTLYAGTAVMEFTGSGAQDLKLPNNEKFPPLLHSGSGTLRILNDSLQTEAFTQTAGTFDLNSFNMQVANNLTLTNGDSTTLLNHALTTITVGGNASFSGQSGNLLNMNPANPWYLDISGTLSADYAKIGNCDASQGSQGVPTVNCVDAGGNTNWAFNDVPTDINLSNDVINENQAIGTFIGFFSTTDPNGSDQHTYTLVSGTGSTDNASFAINGDTLFSNAIFDFETNPSMSIRVRTTDNGVGTLYYEEAFSIIIDDMNDPPVLTGTGGSFVYTENDAATVIDNAITVTDMDNAMCESAEVAITTNNMPTEDRLLFTSQNGIIGSFDSTNGMLTLSGTSALANYQTALRSVTYENSSDNPSIITRTVSFTVYDGSSVSQPVTRMFTVTPINDQPQLVNNTSSFGYNENNPPVTIDDSITVSDPDNSNCSGATIKITAGLSVNVDSLVFVNQNGITGTYNSSTGILGLSGSATIANYQTALRSIAYYNPSDAPSTIPRTISFRVNDGLVDSDSIAITINVFAVNDAPIVADDSYITSQNTPLTITAPGFLANDSDPEGDPFSATLTQNVAVGTLSFNSDGSFTYTPQTDMIGSAFFSYITNDGVDNSDTALVTIQVQDTIDPTIVSLVPALGSIAVPLNTNLTIAFSEDVVVDSGNIYIARTADLGIHETISVNAPGVSGSGSTIITINPTSTLASKTGYYILFDITCFMDTSGNYHPGFAANTQWFFVTEDTQTEPPILNAPLANITLDSTFGLNFSLPEAALSGTVKLSIVNTGGTADPSGTHSIIFSAGFEAGGVHTTTLSGNDLSNNTNVSTVSTEPNDHLVNNALYTITLEYQDTLGNPAASASAANIAYMGIPPIVGVRSASYRETTNVLELIFDKPVQSTSIHTDHRVGLYVNNGTADSLLVASPWPFAFGTTQDTVRITILEVQAQVIESWAEIGTKLSLIMEENTFGDGSAYNIRIDQTVPFGVTYIDDGTPPNPVTGLTVRAVNCSTAAVYWTPSTSPDAKEVKVCASSMAMPKTPSEGELFQFVGSIDSSVTMGPFPTNGVIAYTAAFVVDNADNWSIFTNESSGRVRLPDGDAPINTIQALFRNQGDSAVAVTLSIANNNTAPEKGIYFTLAYKNPLFDTTNAYRLAYRDTSFTVPNINKQGYWHGAWTPYDSSGNVGNFKTDSILINNGRPRFCVNQNYTLFEDSLWTFGPCVHDVNNDPIALTVLAAPPGFVVDQNTLTLQWKPTNSDVGSHRIRLRASDPMGAMDSTYFAIAVQNTNDAPRIASIQYPDTLFEDSLFIGEVVILDPDKGDTTIVSINTNNPWLRVTPKNGTSADSIKQFLLQGVPGNSNTGVVSFTIIAKDRIGAAVRGTYSCYVINTNDAPTTTLKSKRISFGAAQYSMIGRDDFDTTLLFHGTMTPLAKSVDKRATNTTGLFNWYPLSDGNYVFSCYTEDQAGLIDLTPYVDTFTIRGATMHTWSDSGQWHMVSVPSESFSAASFKQAGKILHWDESKEPNSIYKYYTRSDGIAALTGDKAYWTKQEKPLSLALTLNPNAPDSVIVNLAKAAYGWNQIASPFPYPIKWNLPYTLWQWNPRTRDYEEAQSVLYPWKGYWVLVDHPQQVVLKGTPIHQSRSAVKTRVTKFVDKTEWIFNMSLVSNINRDEDNLFGIAKDAQNGYDLLDRPEPPRMGSEPRLYFAHPEWQRSVAEYASDIRQHWNEQANIFQVGISACDPATTSLSLSISGLNEKSPIYIFIKTKENFIAYTPNSVLAISPTDQEQFFTLFVTANKDFLNTLPKAFSLGQPYPNPCNPRAIIPYVIPYKWDSNGWLQNKPFTVTMRIYDARGRLVRDLVHKKQKPGFYSIIWHGKSNAGRLVPSGTYFCRLIADDFATVKKIVTLR